MDYSEMMKTLSEQLTKQGQGIVEEINRKIDDAMLGLTTRIQVLEDDNVVKNEKINSLKTTCNDLDDRVKSLEEDNTALQAAATDMVEENDGLKSEILLLKNDMEMMKDDMMRNEQYTRKNNVKIYGLPERKDESCVDIVRMMLRDKLRIEINRDQIAVAHRIAGRSGKVRPIIVRFDQHDVKFTVLKQRRQLKGSGVSIQEDLVKAVWDKLAAIKDSEDCADTWAWNGKIFIKDRNDRIHKYSYGTRIPDPFR